VQEAILSVRENLGALAPACLLRVAEHCRHFEAIESPAYMARGRDLVQVNHTCDREPRVIAEQCSRFLRELEASAGCVVQVV